MGVLSAPPLRLPLPPFALARLLETLAPVGRGSVGIEAALPPVKPPSMGIEGVDETVWTGDDADADEAGEGATGSMLPLVSSTAGADDGATAVAFTPFPS